MREAHNIKLPHKKKMSEFESVGTRVQRLPRNAPLAQHMKPGLADELKQNQRWRSFQKKCKPK
jgi:hypothetical protein